MSPIIRAVNTRSCFASFCESPLVLCSNGKFRVDIFSRQMVHSPGQQWAIHACTSQNNPPSFSVQNVSLCFHHRESGALDVVLDILRASVVWMRSTAVIILYLRAVEDSCLVELFSQQPVCLSPTLKADATLASNHLLKAITFERTDLETTKVPQY